MTTPWSPKDPNCDEMVKWVITQPDYLSKTTEDLRNDIYIRTISSACEKSIEEVIKIFQDRVKQKRYTHHPLH